MDTQPHPLKRPGARRILDHTLVDLCDEIGADSFLVDEQEITFLRRARCDAPAQRFPARIGDWLVPAESGWEIVPDPASAAPMKTPARATTRLERAG